MTSILLLSLTSNVLILIHASKNQDNSNVAKNENAGCIYFFWKRLQKHYLFQCAKFHNARNLPGRKPPSLAMFSQKTALHGMLDSENSRQGCTCPVLFSCRSHTLLAIHIKSKVKLNIQSITKSDANLTEVLCSSCERLKTTLLPTQKYKTEPAWKNSKKQRKFACKMTAEKSC